MTHWGPRAFATDAVQHATRSNNRRDLLYNKNEQYKTPRRKNQVVCSIKSGEFKRFARPHDLLDAKDDGKVACDGEQHVRPC